jgi:Sulfotransferase family
MRVTTSQPNAIQEDRTMKGTRIQAASPRGSDLAVASLPRRRSPLVSFAHRASRRLWHLDGQKLCAEAQRLTGLADFGDPPLQPALSILLKSLEQEADLHPLGRMLMRIHLCDLLETRLRLAEAWKGKREALETRAIEKPVFVVGTPRSGSTFLHELLAEDPGHRAPRVWEVMFPVGAPQGVERDRKRRTRKAETCLWWFRRLAPEADAVYPMRARTPHECVAIHSYTLLSEEFVSTCRIPAYEAFLKSADLVPAYLWQKRFLQHLDLDCPSRRWVLKSPDHVCGLEGLFSVFPDARIVQTHRNPLEMLKSSADLTRVLRGLYGPPGDLEEMRAQEAKTLAERTERFLQFRDLHPELAHRFVDVNYAGLVANPVVSLRRIYEQLDSPLTEAVANRMQRLAASRSRYRGRRASSEPGGLNLNSSTEAGVFERYCLRFGLSSQEKALSP